MGRWEEGQQGGAAWSWAESADVRLLIKYICVLSTSRALAEEDFEYLDGSAPERSS